MTVALVRVVVRFLHVSWANMQVRRWRRRQDMMTSTVHGSIRARVRGRMRNSYSAGTRSASCWSRAVLHDDVYGLSTGATDTIDYVSRDALPQRNLVHRMSRRYLSFRWWVMPFVRTPTASARHYTAMRASAQTARCPADFDAFQANPARHLAGHRPRHGREPGLFHARRFS